MPGSHFGGTQGAALRESTRRAEVLAGVFANALQQIKAFVADLADEALVDQSLDEIDRRRRSCRRTRPCNGSCGFKREPAFEDRQPREHGFLGLAQQFP